MTWHSISDPHSPAQVPIQVGSTSKLVHSTHGLQGLTYLHSLLIPVLCETSNLTIFNFKYCRSAPLCMFARLLNALVRLSAMTPLRGVPQQNVAILSPGLIETDDAEIRYAGHDG